MHGSTIYLKTSGLWSELEEEQEEDSSIENDRMNENILAIKILSFSFR